MRRRPPTCRIGRYLSVPAGSLCQNLCEFVYVPLEVFLQPLPIFFGGVIGPFFAVRYPVGSQLPPVYLSLRFVQGILCFATNEEFSMVSSIFLIASENISSANDLK